MIDFQRIIESEYKYLIEKQNALSLRGMDRKAETGIKEKNEQLERILGSKLFENSKRNQDLLRYLCQTELENKPIKELSIAMDIFSKDESFDPSEDTLVRVSIGNLRKKLENYYYTEGVDDPIKIEIPKGRYNVVFKTDRAKPNVSLRLPYNRNFLPVIIALISLIIISYLLYQNYLMKSRANPVSKKNPIWYEFINSDKPNAFIVGDYFFMSEKHETDPRRIFIRDPRVNSRAEYDLKNASFYRDWRPLEFSYFRQSILLSAISIVPILRMNNQNVQIIQSSDLKWNDFSHSNMVYAGTIKSLNELEKLLPNFNIRIEKDSVYQIQRLSDEGEVAEVYALPRLNPKFVSTDYTYIGKIKGPGGHPVMIITSGDEVGLSTAVDLITNPDILGYIREYDPEISFRNPFYFDMVIRTRGLRSTGFNHEIVYFNRRD
jgi:hypothetical protein